MDSKTQTYKNKEKRTFIGINGEIINNSSNQIAEHFRAMKEAKKLQFPLEIFPEKIQEIISHFHIHKGYPKEFFAASILTAVGGAVGNSCYMVTPNGYKNKAVINMLIVASPGINKSSPTYEAFKPIFERQNLQYLEYLAAMKAKVESEKHNKGVKEENFFLKQIVSDLTPEALVNQLARNTRGTVAFVDEIAGFINSFGRYSKGNDKQLYLSLWQGSPIIRDTLSRGTQQASDPFLSIIGTIQPDVLKKIFQEDGDGFFDRWLICYPDKLKKPYPSNTQVDKEITHAYRHIIEKLNDLYLSDAVNELQYSNDAWQVVYRWICRNTDQENSTSVTDLERGIRAKMQIYIHRFALIMQLLEYGCHGGLIVDKLEIRLDAANGAVALAEYFFSMAEKARLKQPGELVTGLLKELYDLLPEDVEFKKVDFLERCRVLEILDRTAANYLRQNIGKLWNKIKYNTYIKI